MSTQNLHKKKVLIDLFRKNKRRVSSIKFNKNIHKFNNNTRIVTRFASSFLCFLGNVKKLRKVLKMHYMARNDIELGTLGSRM